MAELTWEKNSKAMFDKCIEGSPKPFRAMTEKKLMEALTKKAGDAAVVNEPAPAWKNTCTCTWCRDGPEIPAL